ncbi:MAG: hypothetical protein V3S98_09455, partial [Dehalococcoidia bacterium]
MGTLSIWFNPLNVVGQKFLIDFDNPSIIEIALEAPHKLTLFASRDTGGSAFILGMDEAFVLDDNWRHVIWSWNNEAGSEDVKV